MNYLKSLFFIVIMFSMPVFSFSAETEVVDETVVVEETETVIPAPLVTGVVYTQERGSVTFDNGVTKNFTVDTMGFREYDYYFSKVRIGKPEPMRLADRKKFLTFSVPVKNKTTGKNNIVTTVVEVDKNGNAKLKSTEVMDVVK